MYFRLGLFLNLRIFDTVPPRFFINGPRSITILYTYNVYQQNPPVSNKKYNNGLYQYEYYEMFFSNELFTHELFFRKLNSL